MSVKKPKIGITLGDVAGVGPEVAVKALLDPSVQSRCIPVLIGDFSVVRHYAERLAPLLPLRTLESPDQAVSNTRSLQILDLKNVEFSKVKMGEVDVACGRAALDYIRAGVNLCLKRELDALATGPIHKEAAQLAGINAPGHTEYLAALCGVAEVRMLLVVNHLRAMHISTHLSLRQALDYVKKDRILETIHYGVGALKQLRIEKGRIGVAGLNPHAGEGGLFGSEEIEEVAPAVAAARAEGLCVSGPVPPDTIFHRMNHSEFDLVIALYHDQGHIPLKLMGFDSGVNVTIGLPIIRTSVDHGTAFDIAGQLKANPESMVKAIELACVMSGK
ncbi:MAG: 4-hydroxythreonine-4-phosphate dehydrogenase PdxA [Acidobacteria bacterium]|nr:4-hydroxythreonine-4-phosphate dehydrogenase PdxA [Acidobacteriota bacterium]MCI0722849.1 4-hydroxythreonine-4-phosphate dehydrogenase PdxA [Acidobacteriota bacterium]